MITVHEALVEIDEGKDFDSLSDVLMDLTSELATKTPKGSPRSIATTVFHMAFWQDRWLKQIEGIECEPFKSDGSDFALVDAHSWIKVRDNFLAEFARMKELSTHVTVFEKPTQFGDTVEGIFLRTALHTSYHVGQIALLRQLL